VVLEIDDCWLANVERDLARTYKFANIHHRLEFFGVCPKCQASAGPAAH
jgi:Fe2+ or Zn2+ uptake regulation protein